MIWTGGVNDPSRPGGRRRFRRWAVLLPLLPVLAFAVAWLLTRGDYPVAATVTDDASLPVIEANGYRFHGGVFGAKSAPPVIVLHGGPGWDYRSLRPSRPWPTTTG